MRILCLLLVCCWAFSLCAQETTFTYEKFVYPWFQQKLPLQSLNTYEGNKITLFEDEETIYVINFWYASCPPCISEMPALNKFKAEFESKGVKCLAVSFDDQEDIQAVLKYNDFDFTLCHLDADVIREKQLTIGYPTNLLVDSDGTVVFMSFGASSDPEKAMAIYEELAAEVQKLLASKAK